MVTASGSAPDLLAPGRRGAGIEGGRSPQGLVGRKQLWRLLRQRPVPAVAGQVDGHLSQRAGVAARRPVDGRRVPGPVTAAQLPPRVAAIPPEVRRGPRADHRAVVAQLDDHALPVVAVVAVEGRDVGVGGARVGQVLPVLHTSFRSRNGIRACLVSACSRHYLDSTNDQVPLEDDIVESRSTGCEAAPLAVWHAPLQRRRLAQ